MSSTIDIAREKEFRNLGKEMQVMWDTQVGPTVTRSRERSADRYDEAASLRQPLSFQQRRDENRASFERESIEKDSIRYDELSHKKWILAILIGNYDHAIRRGRPGGTAGNVVLNARLLVASRQRAKQINVSCDY